ncbi:saccharopine dehydrogenase [Kribbella sp. ALI-6-A]|uniref:saccharopine dehydrogenase n=1 Tax=Kribbella sp. ALI-6-A TaxID=1933817 RepID=UPI00097BE7A8|nr:saccharopine dehydrogenase [Kribbella sp. ALI-6-A]ONI73735.1 saccharopine dehydrogenase [Kribbella sp. ALI-6-A]
MDAVLMLGGTGQAGADTAALLRRWHPDLPLTIAGRDLGRAQKVADELGGATAVTTDLSRRDLGLPTDRRHSAVVATLWDAHHNGLQYAQDRGVPYTSISSALVDTSPELVAVAQRPTASPVLVASHWCAGTAVLAALASAQEFGRVDRIRAGAILDELDTGGPAGNADLERWSTATTAGLVRRSGRFTWIAGADVEADVVSLDGTAHPGQSIAILDVTSLALATGAADVRFDMAIGESAGRRTGGRASVEVRIELEGSDQAGNPLTRNRYLVHPEGQRPLTALGLALGVERLLGLSGGDPVAPGLHTPESLVDPAYAVRRIEELGGTFVDR